MNDTNQMNAGKHARYPSYKRPGQNRIWIGFFIVTIGVLFLLRQMGVPFPNWFFSWPMLFIGAGLFIGITENFRDGGWLVPILFGGVFLIDRIIPEFSFRNYLWPIVIIAIGLYLVLRPKKNNKNNPWQLTNQDAPTKWEEPVTTAEVADNTGGQEYIDATAVFGGVNKMVLSKNFKGGEIFTFMGGTNLNLTQADITQPISIETTNIFGGTKIIIPPSWDIQSEVVTIFGGVDDKRQINAAAIDRNKVVRLTGTCLFGGIEIKSF